jgi:Fe2+ or Zn2+ uptake regulation protein
VGRERWVVFVLEELRRAGHQHSSPRLRVLRALAGAERPVTAQELEDELRASTPVARGTIYHALELLDRHGFAYRLELGEGQARYLAADPRETPPHFLPHGSRYASAGERGKCPAGAERRSRRPWSTPESR